MGAGGEWSRLRVPFFKYIPALLYPPSQDVVQADPPTASTSIAVSFIYIVHSFIYQRVWAGRLGAIDLGERWA